MRVECCLLRFQDERTLQHHFDIGSPGQTDFIPAMKQNRDQTQSSAQAGANKCPDPRPLNGSQQSACRRATGCGDDHLLRLVYNANRSITPGPAIR